MADAYPLQWPAGWPRSESRQWSNFKNTSIFKCYNEVMDELRRLGARSIVVSTNMPIRLDGVIKSGMRSPPDTGVAVYFLLGDTEKCIPIDRWNKVEDNLRAIAKTVEAMRGIERWGAKNLVDAAFRGFQALPPPDGYAMGEQAYVKIKRNPREVLNIAPGINDLAYLEYAFKQAAKKTHPDGGGSSEEFAEVKEAYDALRKEMGA